ncbi:MAG: DUF1294 domain-containing protein [Clostridia bacterium]|nr:DUF1294 domain-containing protein [Clostridia bacterium]
MIEYEIFTPRGFLVYLLIINGIGLTAMFLDKWKAEKGSWRIPEKSLFTITFLGGGIGTIIGMYLFRHKTKKIYFTIGFPVILFTEIFIGWYIWSLVH